MEKAPSRAAYIRERGPPFMFMPPNTSAISIFMPTEEPDEAESVGVCTISSSDASPIPMPASAKEATVSRLARMPDSRAQIGLPPRKRCLRPSGRR